VGSATPWGDGPSTSKLSLGRRHVNADLTPNELAIERRVSEQIEVGLSTARHTRVSEGEKLPHAPQSEFALTRVSGQERDGNPTQLWVATYSPDGKWLATGAMLGSLWLWETSNYQAPRQTRGPSQWVNRIAFTPDSRMFASSSDDGTVRVWSVDKG